MFRETVNKKSKEDEFTKIDDCIGEFSYVMFVKEKTVRDFEEE